MRKRPSWKRQVIEHDEDFCRCDLVKMRDRQRAARRCDSCKLVGLTQNDLVRFCPERAPFFGRFPVMPQLRGETRRRQQSRCCGACARTPRRDCPSPATNGSGMSACKIVQAHEQANSLLRLFFLRSRLIAGAAAAPSPSSFFSRDDFRPSGAPSRHSAATGSSSTVGRQNGEGGQIG